MKSTPPTPEVTLRERERCAKIAEAYAAEQPMNHNLDDGAAIARRFAALEIARRIRK